jgi:hypothetical protein
MDTTMALARRALLLAFLAVCALLLAVGVVGPGDQPRDHVAAEGLAAAAPGAAAEATSEAGPALITSITKQASPLVLLATSETAAVRRGRHRVRPVGRRTRGRRRGHRPESRPGGGTGPRGRSRRLRPVPTVRVDDQFARMALEFNVLVGHFRY